MKKSRLILILMLTLLVCSVTQVSGQYYFGKNKVQYSHLDWYVLRSDHFDIYYYKGEEELAEIAAFSAEKSYRDLEDKFNLPLTKRVPLIVYSSPNYFDQTNVISQLLPENVGGFTEFFKGRVVVPFDGSYYDFDRILRHELVHVFTYAKISQVTKDHKRLKFASPPLWFTEGIAEYWSSGWEPSEDMITSDLVLAGVTFDESSIYSISGTYLMYKLGESLLQYMAATYGEDKILMIFQNWWKGGSFREIIEYTFGVSIKEIFEGWQYYLKKRYYPVIADAELPHRAAKALTDQGFSVKPVMARLSIDGDDDLERGYLIYKANKLGYSGIYMHEGGKPIGEYETLVKGERSPQFESLHLLDSDISVSKSGKLAFASRHYERDVLYIYDLRSRKVEQKLDFSHLIVVQSPSWSPDGSQIVFNGCRKDGSYDLYVYNLAEDSLTQLSDDFHYDGDAVFTTDGSGVLFCSDRSNGGNRGYRNLFRMDLATGKVTQITWGKCHDAMPSFSPDGRWIVFQSDRDGIPNIYAIDSTGGVYRVGKLASGIFDPSFTPSGDSIVFAAYEEHGITIYSIAFADSLLVPVENEPVQFAGWTPSKITGESVKASFKYKSDFSFDFAQSAIGYDVFYGSIGGFQMAYTDMLGNHQYYLLLYNNATTRSDFLSSFNVGLTYVNREGRLNYGAGVFHLFDEYDNIYDGIYDERQFGGLGLVSYPFSKFRRIEVTSVLRKSERYVFYRDSTRHAILSTTYLSYVKDNSLWDISGPIDGTRYNFTLGLSLDLKSGRNFTRIALADVRNYFRLGKRSAFATRVFGYTSSGKEPQRLYLGGSWSLRGFDRRAFYGRNLVLWSNELRFPLIDNLFIGLPFGRIGFSGIRGAIFWDTGSAWNDDFDRLYGAVGFGARVGLGYMTVLRFDFTRTTDYVKLSDSWKFDFFFGWNF